MKNTNWNNNKAKIFKTKNIFLTKVGYRSVVQKIYAINTAIPKDYYLRVSYQLENNINFICYIVFR